MNWQKLYNPLVIWLLRSPLRAGAAKSTVVLTVTGRKSGKRYTLPVSYIRDGETLLIVSERSRTWWKNLRGGAPVTVLLQGKTLQATGEVYTDTALAKRILLEVVHEVPAYQRLLHLSLDANGQPEDPEALTRLAEAHVVIRLKELAALAA